MYVEYECVLHLSLVKARNLNSDVFRCKVVVLLFGKENRSEVTSFPDVLGVSQFIYGTES